MARTKRTASVVAVFVVLLGTVNAFWQAFAQQPPASSTTPKPKTGAAPTETKAAKSAATATNATATALIFRNVPSWNRQPDFEDTLTDMGVRFEVKSSAAMGTLDMAPYRFVIIPGAQGQTDYYQQYAAHAERFDAYVKNGGTLVFEMNGAENDGIPLPRGVSMVRHGSRENSIAIPGHPILTPLGGRPIRANYASHGYLDSVPPDALVLAMETTDGLADTNKPTFVEYTHGAGRVIAACQCFHDRDGSHRGPLMETVLTYALDRKWYSAPQPKAK